MSLKCLNACFHSCNLVPLYWHTLWSYRTGHHTQSPFYGFYSAIQLRALLAKFTETLTITEITGSWCRVLVQLLGQSHLLPQPTLVPENNRKHVCYSLTCKNIICEGLDLLNKSLVMTRLKSIPQASPCTSFFVPPLSRLNWLVDWLEAKALVECSKNSHGNTKKEPEPAERLIFWISNCMSSNAVKCQETSHGNSHQTQSVVKEKIEQSRTLHPSIVVPLIAEPAEEDGQCCEDTWHVWMCFGSGFKMFQGPWFSNGRTANEQFHDVKCLRCHLLPAWWRYRPTAPSSPTGSGSWFQQDLLPGWPITHWNLEDLCNSAMVISCHKLLSSSVLIL